MPPKSQHVVTATATTPSALRADQPTSAFGSMARVSAMGEITWDWARHRVATVVEADKLPDFPEMTWVKITGTPSFPVEKGRRTSVLKVEKIEPPPEVIIY